MRDAVIVDAVRSPIGKRSGGLSTLHAVDLSAQVLNALVARTGVDPVLVDDVHWGNVISVGQQSGNIGRMAVLGAGWPESVPGFTIDRQCGSSQQAISTAAAAVISGQADIVVAGGVEMMSGVPMGAANVEGTGELGGPAVTRYAEELDGPGLPRPLQPGRRRGEDRHRVPALADPARRVLRGITRTGRGRPGRGPVRRRDRRRSRSATRWSATDEGIRRGSTVEKLAELKAPFLEGGSITAGNASQISDGAAALLIMTSERAKALGLTPLARVHTAVVTGDDPVKMLTGPIPATALALERSGLAIDDIDAFEVNEAFAPVPLAWQIETGAEAGPAQPARRCHRARTSARRLRRTSGDDAGAPPSAHRRPLRPADDVRRRGHRERDDLRAALTQAQRPASSPVLGHPGGDLGSRREARACRGCARRAPPRCAARSPAWRRSPGCSGRPRRGRRSRALSG